MIEYTLKNHNAVGLTARKDDKEIYAEIEKCGGAD